MKHNNSLFKHIAVGIVALLAFAITPTFAQQLLPKVHNGTPVPKAIEEKEYHRTQLPFEKTKTLQKTRRAAAITSVDQLVGHKILFSTSALSNVNMGGNSVEITRVNSTTIAIEHFTKNATKKINVTVNISAKTFSIAANQVLFRNNSGYDVYLRAFQSDGSFSLSDPITGTIDEYGDLVFNTIWGDVYLDTSNNKYYYWDGIWSYSETYTANATMTVNYYQNSNNQEKYNVIVVQNTANDSVIVGNFGNFGQVIGMRINSDKTVTLSSQVGYDISDGSDYGDFYTCSANWSNDNITSYDMIGSITTTAITFGPWTLFDRYVGKYITGKYNDAIIKYMGSETFTLPGSDIIATTSTNSALIQVARAQGWIPSNATQMTKSQAAAVKDIGTVFSRNTDLTSFDEFQYFTGVTELNPNSNGIGAFEGCSNLHSITLPSTIKTIGNYSFWSCNILVKANIPDAVTSIGNRAYYNCALTSVTIPKNVSSIGNNPFNKCESLTEILVNSQNAYFTAVSGVLFNKEKTALISYPIKKSGSSYSVPSGVTTLKSASMEYTTLTSITLPTTLTTIEDYSLAYCPNLTSITIPKNVSSIYYPFVGSTKIKEFSVNSQNSNFIVDNGVLMSKDKTRLVAYPPAAIATAYTIPSSVTTIDESAFYSAQKLNSVEIPSGVTSIGYNAFCYIENLTKVTALMQTPCTVSDNCFYNSNDNAYNNAILYVPAGRKSAYQSTNYWNKFKNIQEISNNSQVIATTSTNNALIQVARAQGWIPSNATQMTEEQAAAVTSIGKAFNSNNDITSLSELQYFTGITSIDAFSMECSKLTTVTIPRNVRTIGNNPFRGCYALKEIKVDTQNNYYCSVDGVLFNKGKTDIISYPNAKATTYNIPTGTTIIKSNAFGWCNSLKTVTLATSIRTIENYAFNSCSALTSVTIPNNVNNIGYNPFINCTKLQSITVNSSNSYYTSDNGVLFNKNKTNLIAFPAAATTTDYIIPTTVQVVGQRAFDSCNNLLSVEFPASITNIEGQAFWYALKLTKVTANMQAPCAVSESCFHDDVYTKAILYVPAGRKSVYQSTNYWHKFKNIQEINNFPVDFTYEGVTYTLYSNNTACVKALTVKNQEIIVPSYVPYQSKSFKVTEVGSNAFSYDWNYAVTLPSTIATVNSNAFNNSRAAAIIWQSSSAKLTSSQISQMKTQVPNVLIYVGSTSYLASSSLQNTAGVVLGSTAKLIELTDNSNFYCPKQFTATSISYSRNFSMKSGYNGNSAGWETIALPFKPDKIVHQTNGELTPFYNYTSSSTKKPFWLYHWTSSGWKRCGMNYNEPYIICMPNNENYDSSYNLNGKVTFSATGATVYKSTYTSQSYNNRTFLPAFFRVPKSSTIFPINATGDYTSVTGGYAAGSAFISDLREVRPFEGYIYSTNASVRMFPVPEFDSDDEAAGISNMTYTNGKPKHIYDVKGVLVTTADADKLQQTLQQLPTGIYVVDGKKFVKK